MHSGETNENSKTSQTRFAVNDEQSSSVDRSKQPTVLPTTTGLVPSSVSPPKPRESVTKCRHQPAVYISDLDQARLAAGKPASWQEPVDRLAMDRSGEATAKKSPGQKAGKKLKSASFSPDDLRILREVPPHW